MKYTDWRKIVGSLFLTSALLLVLTASAWAQTAASTADVQVEIAPAEPGVLLVSVTPDSPAAKAGLKRGDIVLQVGDRVVNHAAELATTIRAAKVGDKLTLTLQRGDEQRELTLTVGERQGTPYVGVVPYAAARPGPVDRVHIWRAPVPPTMPGPNFSFSQTVGARIITVAPDSPAAAAGLLEGDLLVGLDGQPFTPGVDLSTLLQAYQPGDTVTFQVQGMEPNAAEKAITVTLGQHPEANERTYLGVRVAPQIFFQAENVQSVGPGKPGMSEPRLRQFRFMPPHSPMYPPMMPMTPFGYWFGHPGYGMGWWQPAPPDMFFAQPVLPPQWEDAPDGFWAPAVEIDTFEFAPGHQPDLPPDVLVAPTPDWSEEGPEI